MHDRKSHIRQMIRDTEKREPDSRSEGKLRVAVYRKAGKGESGRGYPGAVLRYTGSRIHGRTASRRLQYAEELYCQDVKKY